MPSTPTARLNAKKRTAYLNAMAKSPLAFGRWMLPGMMTAEGAYMHRILERYLLSLSLMLLNCVAPRGTAKSSIIAVLFALWHTFLEHRYRVLTGLPLHGSENAPRPTFVVILSKTQKSASQRMRSIKNVLGNGKGESEKYSKPFRAIFGDWGEATAEVWQTDKIILKNGSVIVSTSLGGQIHGSNEDNIRPTLAILDDPEDENNTKTTQSIEANRRVLFNGLVPAMDIVVGRIVVIGTPIKKGCMVDTLHDMWKEGNDPTARSVWFRQSVADETSMHSVPKNFALEPYDATGRSVEEDDDGKWLVYPNLLWPEFQTKGRLEARRRAISRDPNLGPGAFTRAYECYMVADSEKVFDAAWLKRTWEGQLVRDFMGQPFLRIIRRGDEYFSEKKPLMLPVGVSAGYDLAYSVEAHASWTAAAYLATCPDDCRYELPGLRDKLLPGESFVKLKELQNELKPTRALAEANGPQLHSYHRMMEQRIYAAPDKHVQHQSKIMRIEQLQAPMSESMYYFHVDTPARGEMRSYPRGSLDYLDALEKADRCRLRGNADMTYYEKETYRAPYYSPMTT